MDLPAPYRDQEALKRRQRTDHDILTPRHLMGQRHFWQIFHPHHPILVRSMEVELQIIFARSRICFLQRRAAQDVQLE